MIVYVVEEEYETDWSCYNTEIVGIYESKDKALAKVKEMEKINKYHVYDITAYATETGGIITDRISSWGNKRGWLAGFWKKKHCSLWDWKRSFRKDKTVEKTKQK